MYRGTFVIDFSLYVSFYSFSNSLNFPNVSCIFKLPFLNILRQAKFKHTGFTYSKKSLITALNVITVLITLVNL